ncbi:response regulator [Anabaena azotica]|uniref:ATP-binding response regulator n=1 Tax=Anabaena azotica TaxID=197653 RepID=UPI0039A6FA6A
MSLILIIEDETQIRLNLQEILELVDFSVVTAVNGAMGLQLAKNNNPDLILCDIMMPGLDGYEVLQELRNDPKTANIPFIFLTAKADRNDLRQGMEIGADDYITKPFEPFEIIQAIQTRLARYSLTQQSHQPESHKVEKLQQQMKINQSKLQNSQQLAQIRENILEQLSQELRNPLSTINMGIYMLKESKNDQERDKYLSILQQECAKEIEILNEVDSLRALLTAENTKLLKNYKLLDS